MGRWEIPYVPPTLFSLDVNILFLLLGIYGWEYTNSLFIEIAVIRGRLAFRWSLIPYLFGRTSLLMFLIASVIATSPFVSSVDCLCTTLLIFISEHIALGCSSTIFMIHTWVIWKDSRVVRGLLVLVMLGQWSLLALGVSGLEPVEVNGVCDVHQKYAPLCTVTFVYTTCYDFLVLVLSIVGLSRQRSRSPLKRRLKSQGIIYFVIAVVAYMLLTISALLKLNYLLIIFLNCAVTAGTIVSCRAVRSLLTLDISKPGKGDSDMELTTGIAIHTPRSSIFGGRRFVDEECMH